MTERYTPNGIPLTDHEREILTILQEEAAEVICAASKLIRFGKENRPDNAVPNTVDLGMECGDLSYMIGRAEAAGLIYWRDVAAGDKRKHERLAVFMQTSPAKPNRDRSDPEGGIPGRQL